MTETITFILRFTLFAVVHSLCATDRVKQKLHGADRQWYRLCYNGLSVLMFGWVMSAGSSTVLYVVPGVMSLVMYALQLVIAIVLIRCFRQTGVREFLGFAKQTTVPFIDDGCYSIVRHPLYLFSILFMAFNPVMTSRWLMLTILSTVYFVIGGLIEEQRLMAEYGDRYRRYRQRVPFLIPTSGRRAA